MGTQHRLEDQLSQNEDEESGRSSTSSMWYTQVRFHPQLDSKFSRGPSTGPNKIWPTQPHVEQIWKQICEWFPCIRGPYTKEGKSVTGKQCQLRKRCTNYVSSMEPPAGSRRVKGSSSAKQPRRSTFNLQGFSASASAFVSANYVHVCQTTHTQRDRKGRWQGFRGMWWHVCILCTISQHELLLPTGTASKRLLEIWNAFAQLVAPYSTFGTFPARSCQLFSPV